MRTATEMPIVSSEDNENSAPFDNVYSAQSYASSATAVKLKKLGTFAIFTGIPHEKGTRVIASVKRCKESKFV